MLDIFKCKYGLFHDKPVKKDGFPSSQNGWIYSAYASKLCLNLDYQGLLNLSRRCMVAGQNYRINRLPLLIEPPMSRDEIIGMVSLHCLGARFLDSKNWFTCAQAMVKVSFIDQVKVFWFLRESNLKKIKRFDKYKGQYRNVLWKEKFFNAYPVAFRLWWHDRYYIKKFCGIEATVFEWFYFQLYAYTTIKVGDPGKLNVLHLQLSDLKSKFWINKINRRYNFLEYFGEDHVFNKGVK